MKLKSFKTFISEEQLLNEYTKHNIAELIAFGGIPLDPGMFARLGFLEKDQEAYHVTNDNQLEKMAKNQHKKKQISCFTQGGPELARLPSQPNILLRLKGTSVLKGETDIWSLVSTRDRRWLDISTSTQAGEKLNFLILGVLSSVTKKAELAVDVYKTDPKTIAGMIESLSKNRKLQLYRLYLQEMEAMLNRSYKDLIEYIKTAADMKYNEIILTKWEILDCWCLGYEQPSVIRQLSDLGISYAGVMPRRDLSSLKI
jgi:hypothetical protein